MIELIAVFIGFAGGVFGRAWRFQKPHQRFVAFLLPMTFCALLLHVPLLLDVAHTGLARVTQEKLHAWGMAQFSILLWAFLLTGAGWGYAICMETDLEGHPR